MTQKRKRGMLDGVDEDVSFYFLCIEVQEEVMVVQEEFPHVKLIHKHLFLLLFS